ncbi:MAG: hypothetical protein HFE47_00395 [Clostridia bacterium]|nr:hypothetical protein [Clostridia bacterium]
MSAKKVKRQIKPIANSARAAAYRKSVAGTVLSNVGFYAMFAADIAALIILLCGGYVLGGIITFCIALAAEGICVLLLLPKPILQLGIAGRNLLCKIVFLVPPFIELITGLVISRGGDVNSALVIYSYIAATRLVLYIATFVLARLNAALGGLAVLVPIVAICCVAGVGLAAEFPLSDRPLGYTYVVADRYHKEGFVVNEIFDGVRDNVRIPSVYKGLPVVGIDCAGVKTDNLQLPESVTYISVRTNDVRNLTVTAPDAYVEIASGLETLTFTSEKALPAVIGQFEQPPEIFVHRALIDAAISADRFTSCRDFMQPIMNSDERYVMFYTDCNLSESAALEDFSVATQIVPSSASVQLPTPDLTDRKEGDFAFLGWYPSRSYTTPVSQIAENGNVKLYAKYLRLYNVTLYDIDNDVDSDRSFRYHNESEEIVLPVPAEREGYTFCGWFDATLPGSPVKGTDIKSIPGNSRGNRFFRPEYKKVYNITWHTDGADKVTDKMPQSYHLWSDEMPLAENGATKEGYTFMGYYLDSAFKNKISKIDPYEQSDIDVYLKFNENYPITLEYNGGSGDESFPAYYHKESGNIRLPSTQKTGYRFDCWHENTPEGAIVSEIPNGSTGARKYYASWTPIRYRVYYRSDANGELTNTGTVFTYDGENNMLDGDIGFSKRGYKFVGWQIGNDLYEPGAQVTHNYTDRENAVVVAIARWEGISFYVDFVSRASDTEGQQPERTMYTYGEKYKMPDCPYTCKGYRFAGWSYNHLVYQAGTEYTFDFTTEENAVLEFMALWNPISYHIAYLSLVEGGSANITGARCYYGVLPIKVGLLAEGDYFTPQRKGYEFLGWEIDGTVYQTKDEIDFDLTDVDGEVITARGQWEPVTYYVNRNSGATSEIAVSGTMKPCAFIYDDKEKTLGECTMTALGYHFTGWQVEWWDGVSFQTKVYGADEKIAENFSDRRGGTATATAQWAPNVYTIRYDGAGGVGDTARSIFTYNSEGNKLADAYWRNGYTFWGWELTPLNWQTQVYVAGYVMPKGEDFSYGYERIEVGNEEVIATAVWKPVSYSLFYVVDGEAFKSQTLTYDEPFTMEEIPQKEGYTAHWEVSGGDVHGFIYKSGARVDPSKPEEGGCNFASEQGASVTATAVYVRIAPPSAEEVLPMRNAAECARAAIICADKLPVKMRNR